jgi:hypothetical protein
MITVKDSVNQDYQYSVLLSRALSVNYFLDKGTGSGFCPNHVLAACNVLPGQNPVPVPAPEVIP